MKKIAICVILSIVFSSMHYYANSLDTAWYVHSFGLQAVIFVWLWFAFSEYDKRKINERSVLAMITIFQAVDMLTYPIWVYSEDFADFTWPILFSFMIAWLLYVSCRKYEYISDEIVPGNVHICLWKPSKDKSVIMSTCGAPFGSVAIYAYNRLWCYGWGSGVFEDREVSCPDALEKHYTIVDTGVSESLDIELELFKLVGKPARRWKTFNLRINCVSVIKPVLRLLGPQYVPSMLEHIPSLYAQKITRLKDN